MSSSSSSTENIDKRIRRVTVLISGSGSNLQALIDSSLPSASITHVLSSRSNAYGLTRAANASPPIPTSICALKTFLTKNPGSTREDYDKNVARLVLDTNPDLVVLAGWMHILSKTFLDILSGQSSPSPSPTEEKDASTNTSARPPIPIINLHPALPGAFDGANAIGRAYDSFQKGEINHTGVMVHRVVAEVDRGEPLVVRNVEITKEDKLEDLEARIHEVEHQIIVEGAKIVLDELEKQGRA